MSGTTPPGAHNEEQAAAWVRDMFGKVAPRYDLLNHLLSFNADKLWRRRTVARVHTVLQSPGAEAIDLCCGTGDLTLALQRKSAGARVYGSDFCHPMLVEAGRKAHMARVNAPLFESDALNLPLRDESADLITIAFGFRNLANYEAGLLELRRVLKPGGTLAILEFSKPPNPLFARVYEWYSRRVLPHIGAAISGAGDAYTYLPESVRKFPDAEGLARLMQDAGFTAVAFERMTFGVVALHIARV